MKNRLIVIAFLFLLFSCKNRETTPTDDHFITVDDQEQPEKHETEASLAPIWDLVYDSETGLSEPRKLRPVDNDTLTGKKLERIINHNWPKVQIEYHKVSNDTAYISIPNSTVLTQQMGSSGAEQFMVSTTYTFTELKGVKFVTFEFEFGDHANPGTYHRDSWQIYL